MAKTFFSGFPARGDHGKNTRSSDEIMRPTGPRLRRRILHVFLPQGLAPHIRMYQGLLCDKQPGKLLFMRILLSADSLIGGLYD